uniref:Ubiquitin carboxyl-terminal hydrolase n=1 Tax=Cyprinus carpio TaxID=7962 RepID=A0A8C1ZXB0_CYPCA
MECPHLSSSVCMTVDPTRFPNGSPSSWCCSVCRSNKSTWVCLTCLNVHCGRYVNGHAKKHFEEIQAPGGCQRKPEREKLSEKSQQHSVCMDCNSYSTFCYRCDEFVVNDTKLGHVQRVREHLQSLENSVSNTDRQRKRKQSDSSSPDSKLKKDSDGTVAQSATGLRNLGNTCFMNAILQSLSYAKPVPKQLFDYWLTLSNTPHGLSDVIGKLSDVFCRGYQQQDAHEFLRYLLEHLHREMQGSKNGSPSPALSPDRPKHASESKCCINGTSTIVTSVFGGVLQNEVYCLICGTESRKFDPFLDLSLDIPSQFRIKFTKDQEPGPTCTLNDCLQSFTDLEELDETELYMCHKCKTRQKSTKKFWIQKLPKVLCLHLKRFHWTAFLRNKIDTYLLYMISHFILLENCLYDLAAVVVHHGSSIGSGHYTAYGLHEHRWYHFNDSTVTLVSEEAVLKAKAYILFYTERSDQESPAKL